MAVIADGTAYNYASIHGGGATRWRAPELIAPEEFKMPNGRPTFQSDIFSWAMVAIEVCRMAFYDYGSSSFFVAQLLTGQPPFAELQGEYQVIKTIMNEGRPSRPVLPDGAPLTDELWSIMIWSWIHDPNARPSVKSVIQTLESALEKLSFKVDFSPSSRRVMSGPAYLQIRSEHPASRIPKRATLTVELLDSHFCEQSTGDGQPSGASVPDQNQDRPRREANVGIFGRRTVVQSCLE